MRSIALFAAALLLTMGSPVDAQNAAQRGYLQGSLVLTFQPEGVANHRVSPPVGGTGLGAAAAGGYFITRSLALEGELLFAGGISTAQVFSYNWREEYTTEFSAVSVNGLLRWKPGGRSPVELVVGGGLAALNYATRDRVRIDSFPRATRTPLPDSSSTETVPDLTGGADVVLPTGSKVAVVGSLRARWRAGTDGDDYPGISRFALDMGVGVRVRF